MRIAALIAITPVKLRARGLCLDVPPARIEVSAAFPAPSVADERGYWRVKMAGGPQGVLLPFSHDTPSSLKWFVSMKV